MPALIVLNYDVHDAAALARYRLEATPVLLGEGAARLVLTTDRTEAIPEGPPSGTHTVVLSTSSVASAIRLYRSDGYQRLLPIRLGATTPRAAFVVPIDRSG